jgi:endonuclease I
VKHFKLLISSIIAFIFLSTNGFSQIPQGYYDEAVGLKGGELKTALYNIIKGHTIYPYTSTSTDTWDILKETDRDTNNPENVLLVYTDWSVNAAQEYNNGNGWSREHCWPKSHGFPLEEQPAYTDIHHLKPIDISVNSARNDRWYAECDVPYWDDGGTIPTDSWTSYTEWVWKPRNPDKGDCARMMFYMATRYEGDYNPVAGVTEPDLELLDYIQVDNNSPLPYMSLLPDLLAWHVQDPVDNYERNRNNVIYSYQGNRNPFIDRPEYVCMIFGENCPTVEDPSYITATGDSIDRIKIEWQLNPVSNGVLLAWNTINDFGTPSGVYSIGDPIPGAGMVLYTGAETTFIHTGLSQSNYYYKVWSLDSIKAYSAGINTSAAPLLPESMNDPDHNSERIKIYPNPTDGMCTVEAEKGMIITISDISGQVLQKQTLEQNKNTLDLSILHPGIYFVNFRSSQTNTTRRCTVK